MIEPCTKVFCLPRVTLPPFIFVLFPIADRFLAVTGIALTQGTRRGLITLSFFVAAATTHFQYFYSLLRFLLMQSSLSGDRLMESSNCSLILSTEPRR